MERVMGIEPTQSAWKAEVLPLNYTRKNKKKMERVKGIEPSIPPWQGGVLPLNYTRFLSV